MTVVIYILIGLIVLIIADMWIETYREAKYIEQRKALEQKAKQLTEEDKIKLGTLQKFKEMVIQNDSELKRKEINRYQHEQKNKEISELIDKYEKDGHIR